MKKNKINTLVIIGISILTAQSYAAEKRLEKTTLLNDHTDHVVQHTNFEAIYISDDGQIVVGDISIATPREDIFTQQEKMNNPIPYDEMNEISRWSEKNGITMIKLRGLIPDADEYIQTHIRGMSKDGTTLIGSSQVTNSTNKIHRYSFRWNEKTGTKHLNTNVFSDAYAVSENGNIIAGQMLTNSHASSAFIWTEKNGMRSLGTLKSDNSGHSKANSISADGSTIIGDSYTDQGELNAFRWTKKTGMQGLGTLKSDNSGLSTAYRASANGHVVIGESDTDNHQVRHAFRWTETTGMVDLGTLGTNSIASFISKDGSIIAGHSDINTQTDDVTSSLPWHNLQAFRWTEKTGMVSLGSLKRDNSGDSIAYGMTDTGSVIVGAAKNDQDKYNAYRWTENTGMVNLGTLASDNSGSSAAQAVSSDGLVIVGLADSDNGRHVALWKIKSEKNAPDVTSVNARTSSSTKNTPKVTVVNASKSSSEKNAPKVAIVDASNSSKAMLRTASRGFAVLDFYQSILNNLSNSRCQLGEGNYCVGLLSQYNNLNDNHHAATGFYSALRLPVENWTTGAALNFTHNTMLIDNYDTQGSNHPAISLFTRYQKNRNNDGLYADLSAAYLSQDIRITRDTLANTEPGEGNSTVKGYQTRLGVGYGISVTPQTQLMPEMALSYNKMNRRGYTESRHAEFEAKYGRIENKRINLQLGLNIKHRVSELLQLHGKIGTNTKLYSNRDAFTGYISYIGAYSYDKGAERTINPYASAGLNVNATKNSILRSVISWQQNDYKYGSTNIGLSYSYNW
ncbi:TPA: autotransporter domain-containing protein [Providencia rettgeri]